MIYNQVIKTLKVTKEASTMLKRRKKNIIKEVSFEILENKNDGRKIVIRQIF